MVNNYIEHIEAVCQKANNIGMIVLRLARKGILGGGGVYPSWTSNIIITNKTNCRKTSCINCFIELLSAQHSSTEIA